MPKLFTFLTILVVFSAITTSLVQAQTNVESHSIFLPLASSPDSEASLSEESLVESDERALFDPLLDTQAANDPPANPNAASATRAVLAYLQRQSTNCEVIAGQDINFLDDALNNHRDLVAALQGATGKWVGIVGADYASWNNLTDLTKTNTILINHWKSGGLVELSWHAPNPWTGGDAWDQQQANLTNLLTPGTAANRQWLTMLDRVAVGLNQLQQAGVVVIWRPFHEMNGNWFWWGMNIHPNDPEPYRKLWRHMFDYFTYSKGLNNLLWAYSTSPEADASWTRPVEYYYPGANYVDIVGQDIYQARLDNVNYTKLVGMGKPFAITEFGPSPTTNGSYDYMTMLNQILTHYPQTVYWLSWSDWYENGSLVHISMMRNQNANTLMNHNCVVTRDEINWQQAMPPTPTPITPTPVVTPPPTATPIPDGNDSELSFAFTNKAPAIDGKVDAVWQRASAALLTHFVLGNPTAANDLSATLRGLYDKNNLYLLIEINDEITRKSTTPDWWQNDGVEIYIDGDRSAGASYDGVNDFLLGLRWNDSKVYNTNGSVPMPKGKFKFIKTAQGQRLEISLALASLGISPNAGASFGLDVHVNDDDGNHRESKLAWHSTLDDAWMHPSSFGVGKLAAME